MKLLYRCYSENLKSYLQAHGLSYELKAKDIKTDVPFCAFFKTDQLEYYLDRWQNPDKYRKDEDFKEREGEE